MNRDRIPLAALMAAFADALGGQTSDQPEMRTIIRDERAVCRYRGVYPNKGRSPPLTTVSAEPGLPAGSRDPP